MGKKVLKIVNHIITSILVVVFILVAILAVSSKIAGGEPQFLDYQLKTVLSGSMEPGIQTGSIIAVKTGGDMTRFGEGDVITFMDDQRRMITHRIVEVVENNGSTMYRTKGDNNEEMDQDLVLSQNVVAEYTGFTIPYVGYVADFVQSKNGIILTVILPGVLLLVYSAFSIWKSLSLLEKQYTLKKNEENTEEASITK